MSTSTETNPFELAERRAARLTMVLEGYEVGDEGMPDATVPGAARVEYVGPYKPHAPRIPRKHPPFVLLTQYGEKGNYRAYLANDMANVEQLARLAVCDGESIVVYFDLDELAGEEPLPSDVTYEGETWDVHGFEYAAGEKTGQWVLKKSPADRRSRSYDWATVNPSECDVGGWEDERMPVRYGLAKVVVSVVFNTVPSP